MPMPDFRRLFGALFTGRGRAVLQGKLAKSERTLMRLFDTALAAGYAAPLSAINAPMNLHPNSGDVFWYAPAEGSHADKA